MRTVATKTGWKEITTKCINVTKIGSRPLMIVDTWIEVTDRLFPNSVKRNRCFDCHKDWKDQPLLGNVNLVFTDKGNKTLCDSCCRILKERLENG